MRVDSSKLLAAALVAALASPAGAQRLAGSFALPVGVATRGATSGFTLAPDVALGAGRIGIAASAMMMNDGSRLWLPAGVVAVTGGVLKSRRLDLDAVGDLRRDALQLVAPSGSASLGADARLQIAGGTTVDGSGRLVRRWNGDGALPGGESSLTAWTAAWRAIDVGGALRSRWGSAREESIDIDSMATDVRQCARSTRAVDGIYRTVYSCPRHTSSFDAAVGVRGSIGRLGVSAWLGRRAAARGLTARERSDWGTVRASWTTSAATSLVADLSRQPSDVARGIPAHTRAFIGIRLTPFADRRRVEPPPPVLAPSPSPALEVGPDVGGVRTISIVAPAALSVELTGDMTSWQVVAMTRAADGRWSATLPLAPGEYTCNVRIDGGAWIVPPGLPAIDDALGGRAGVLTVEP